MINVLLVIHLLIAIVLVGLILLQKSEGGAAGAAAGTVSVESMMRPRARPHPIGRATSILGIAFFATSMGLALLARPNTDAGSIMIEPASGSAVPQVNEGAGATPTVPSVPAEPAVPSVPSAPSVPSVPNN